MKSTITNCANGFPGDNEARALECGDLSPLSLPKRLVALAEPRSAARRITNTLTHFGSDARIKTSDASLNAVLLGRQVVQVEKAVTSHRTPNPTRVD